MKDKYTDRKERIEERFMNIFPMRIIGGNKCFIAPNGDFFDVEIFRGNKAIVLGYAEDENYAKNYAFEDGDSFDIDMPEEEMFKGMYNEVIEVM